MPVDLAERFINAYNQIDRFLRDATSSGRDPGFTSVLREYEKKRRGWRQGEDLRALNNLRNVIVHERYAPHAYLAVPTEEVVQRIEVIRDGLLNPHRVIPTFRRELLTLCPSDGIAHALAAVRANNFSQFPVYDGDPGEGTFCGLLTENGLTRWLARHVGEEAAIVDLEDHTVAEALASEEAQGEAERNVAFVRRNLPVDEAQAMFAEGPLLEALLITEHGHEGEKPLGIVTRWDVLRVRADGRPVG